MYKAYKNIENNKLLYIQKLEKFSDFSKNWKDFYDQVKALCSACMSKLVEAEAKPLKIIKTKPIRSEPYTSMTFITLATM